MEREASSKRSEIAAAQSQLVNLRMLTSQEEECISRCTQQLLEWDKLVGASKARFMSTSLEITDASCMSRGFFKMLKHKSRDTLAKIVNKEDGTCITTSGLDSRHWYGMCKILWTNLKL